MQNSSDNDSRNVSIAQGEADWLQEFIDAHDFAIPTRRALASDIRKFACWFNEANAEPLRMDRVSVRDITDFRRYLREERRQAVSTVNRSLVSIRRYLQWVMEQGHIEANAAKQVKELQQQKLAPKGLQRNQVRQLLREVELRKDIRANAIFSMLLFTGCRVSDVTNLELDDLVIRRRSGFATFRLGKGNKQRTCPLPLSARQSLKAYLEVRPSTYSSKVFMGERGPLSDRGIRVLCEKYGKICGFKLFPHILRHSFAHRFLGNSNNDLVGLSQLLGHENVNITSRYCQRSESALAQAAEAMMY